MPRSSNFLRLPLQLLGLLAAAVVVIGWGLLTGPHSLSLGETLSALFDPNHPHHVLVADLRLPRILLPLVAGATLTLGGFLMQALVKNPLADPYIMGVSAGAGLGVNLRLLGIVGIGAVGVFTLPIYAALGAGASLGLVLLLAWRFVQADTGRLLLAGVAVSSLFMALTGLCIYVFAENDTLRQVITWSFGSFAYARWEQVWVSAPLLLVLLAFGLWMGTRLDLAALGDEQAQALGLNLRALRIAVLVMTAVCVGGTVAFTGPIGFVGMMVPHFMRAMNGLHHRVNLLVGAGFGGVYLCLCDVLSQHLYPPVGLPVGIVTALMGVPFFGWLLLRKR
jgi:iron complex transport system permease protein